MKYPMQIYVVWQPSNTTQVDEDVCFTYAKAIFSAFNRTIDEVLDRDIGIPTYFISVAGCLDRVIDWEAAQKTVIVWMINDAMFSTNQITRWREDVQTILEYKKIYKEQVCWVGVSLTVYSYKFYKAINGFNRIELQDCPEEMREEILLRRLTFRLTQELYEKQGNEPLPLTLFLSHARIDGATMAKKFQKVIQQIEENLNTFIDVRNIGIGADFEQLIHKHIVRSVFLVINTNAYNEREWCLKELLFAKEKKRPIVVVNVQRDIIRRTSPYIGNTPVIHSPILLVEKESYNYKQECERITYYVLIETLRYAYHQELLKAKVNGKKNVLIFPVAPELLTMHQQKVSPKQLLVYPDPPLGNVEQTLLQRHFQIEAITSTLYPLLDLDLKDKKYTNILDGHRVGLSVSGIPAIKNGIHEGVGVWHLQDALVELTRYLFVCGATCVYGGNIKHLVTSEVNFSIHLIELLNAYNKGYCEKQKTRKIINHVAALYAASIKKDGTLQASTMDVVKFVYHENELLPSPQGKDTPSALKALYFTYMRQQMFEKCNEAQIFIGGKTEKSQSIILGVIEEAYYALQYNKPIYIIGAFGGASGCLAELFFTGKSETLRKCFEATQAKEDWKDKYKAYVQYIQEHPDWNESPKEIHKRISYTSLKLFFLRHRNKQQDNYLNNGLNRAENETLFQSKNMLEISSLIIKGLYQYFYQ
ncbi:MAG: TIR domain-containing protein [Aureispira sp.]